MDDVLGEGGDGIGGRADAAGGAEQVRDAVAGEKLGRVEVLVAGGVT